MITVPQARTVSQLRTAIAAWRREGLSVGLVPTMGALHAGHLALATRALERCQRVVVSLFVNPTQFAPEEDFGTYPRTEAADLAMLSDAGVHLAWIPAVEDMYPDGFATTISIGGVSNGLDGAHRPGHFDGIATVVAKLLLQVMPDAAFFGEKDYQQLQVVRRLVRDLDIPVRIESVGIVREADGLALSSRNRYLTPEERSRAATLPAVLHEIADAVASRPEGPFDRLLDAARARLDAAGFSPVDYVEICDAQTLAPVSSLARPARVLAAARLGRTRLIDNLPIPETHSENAP